jgi:hypothetical protein
MPAPGKKTTTTRRAANRAKAPSSPKLYTLQVFLIGGPMGEEFDGKTISRTIQIRGGQTLAVLHQAIFSAFDREEMHLYEFQFGKGPMDPKGPRYTPRAVVGTDDHDAVTGHAEDTKIDDLKLKVGRAFGYWFDYGDDWMHQIDVEAVEDAPARGRYPKITARVGKSPPQYPDADE